VFGNAEAAVSFTQFAAKVPVIKRQAYGVAACRFFADHQGQ
jgi:hypothetical protein